MRELHYQKKRSTTRLAQGSRSMATVRRPNRASTSGMPPARSSTPLASYSKAATTSPARYAGQLRGVTVSYFEWVQNIENERWELDEVNHKLKIKERERNNFPNWTKL